MGGAKIADMNRHVHEIVLPYQPRAIVLWAGANDILDGGSGQIVFEGFQSLVNSIHTTQPGVDIFYIGMTRNPGNVGNASQTTQRLTANSLISNLVSSSGNPRLHYIDLPAFFENLSPTELNALYVDSLHLNWTGYRTVWTPAIRAALGAVVPPNRVFAPNTMTPQPGKKLLFDFGCADTTNGRNTTGIDLNGNVWNNWFPINGLASINAGEHISGLRDTTDAPTDVRLTITGDFQANGRNNGGLLAPSTALLGSLGIATATEDYFFSTADGLYGGDDNTPGSFMLSGLSPSHAYDFRIFGSRTISTESRTTVYEIKGANSGFAKLQTSGSNIGSDGAYDGNDDEVSVIGGIRPNAFGEILVDLSAAPGTNFAHINAMEVTVAVPASSQAFNTAVTLAGLTAANALPASIPYNDDVKNLLKYAFNMNLSGPDVRTLAPGTGTLGLPSITSSSSGGTTTLRVEFIRRIGSGLIYTPKRSSDLSSSAWTALSDVPTIENIDTNWERVIYEEPLPAASNPKCFGVVEVSLP